MALPQEHVMAYLERLGMPGRHPQPDFSTLATLQKKHVHSVTFENLSILVPSWRARDLTEEGPKLDIPSLYDKLVQRRRGGYCFELNHLFAELLHGLGYTVRTGAARVIRDSMEVDPALAHGHTYTTTEHSHMVLFASGGELPQGEVYLCDVGFGGNTLTHPVLLPQPDSIRGSPTTWDPPAQLDVPQYRVRWGIDGTTTPPAGAHDNLYDQGYYLQLWVNKPGAAPGGSWHDLYFFTPATFITRDYQVANYFVSTSPMSFFSKAPLVSRTDETGIRYILFGTDFKVIHPSGDKEAHVVEGHQDRAGILKKYFSIVLPEEEEEEAA